MISKPPEEFLAIDFINGRIVSTPVGAIMIKVTMIPP
jgi:hypothetical protein